MSDLIPISFFGLDAQDVEESQLIELLQFSPLVVAVSADHW